eukprot:gb/GECG01007205.1/.p1 GENE.gb/GECG01007205.1/~~gb/GECG01007205.1/.p1  ORF type:complete len:397 (+),score=50.58 gb/GECG01007205.1/:1-1191(+)
MPKEDETQEQHQASTNAREETRYETYEELFSTDYAGLEKRLIQEGRRRRQDYVMNCLKASYAWINSSFTRRVFSMCWEMPSTVGDGREPIILATEYYSDTPSKSTARAHKSPDPSMVLIWNSILLCLLNIAKNLQLHLPNRIQIEDARSLGYIEDGEATRLTIQGFPQHVTSIPDRPVATSHRRSATESGGGMNYRVSRESPLSTSSPRKTPSFPEESERPASSQTVRDRSQSKDGESPATIPAQSNRTRSLERAYEVLHELRRHSISAESQLKWSGVSTGGRQGTNFEGSSSAESDVKDSQRLNGGSVGESSGNLEESYFFAPEHHEEYQLWFECVPNSSKEFARVMYLLDMNAFTILSETGLLRETALSDSRLHWNQPSSDGAFFQHLLKLSSH